jgi:uncharacterized membrane protein (UPF0127 family)
MRINNRTRQTTLAHSANRATGFVDRLRGLMFVPALPDGGGLLLEPESSIHTFFMKFPLDVLYLDRAYRVLRVEHQMPPSRLGPIYTKGCHAILELPPGVLRASATQVGDELVLEG